MYVLVKDDTYAFRVKCLGSQSVHYVKNEVCKMIGGGCSVDDVFLIGGRRGGRMGGREGRGGEVVMEDNQPLMAYGIEDGDVVKLSFRLKGGAVGIFGSSSSDQSNFSTIWYFVGVLFLVLLPFFMSGILPILGHIYGVAVANMVKKLGVKILKLWDEVSEEVEEIERKEEKGTGIEEGIEMTEKRDASGMGYGYSNEERRENEAGAVTGDETGAETGAVTGAEQSGGGIFSGIKKKMRDKRRKMMAKKKEIMAKKKGMKVHNVNENGRVIGEEKGKSKDKDSKSKGNDKIDSKKSSNGSGIEIGSENSNCPPHTTKVCCPKGGVDSGNGSVMSTFGKLLQSSKTGVQNFYDAVMSTRIDGMMADKELVCALDGLPEDGVTAEALRKNTSISRYYGRVFMLATQFTTENLAIGQTAPSVEDVEDDTVGFFKRMKNKIKESGEGTKDCLHGYEGFKKLLSFISWLFKVFGMWIFVYILTYVIISPLAFAYTNNADTGKGYPTISCTAVGLTRWITLTLVLVYIGIYVLTAMPTLGVEALESAGDKMSEFPKEVVEVLVLPIANLGAKMVSYMQFGLFNLLTYGWFNVYHNALNMGIRYFYLKLAEADTLSCDNQEQMNNLASDISTMLNNPVSKIGVDNWKMGSAANILVDALSEEKLAEEKEKSYIRYLFAKMVRFLGCQGLKTAHWLYKILRNMGSPDTITDLVVDGNMAGVSYSIAFIVILLFVIFSSSMYGIQFS